jgi:hypothetical protein
MDTNKLALRIAFGLFLGLSLAVIFAPSLFYTGSELDAALVSKLDAQLPDTDVFERIDTMEADMRDVQQRIKRVKAKTGYFSRPDRRQELALSMLQTEERTLALDLAQAEHIKENVMLARRSMTPVWSQLAFDQARDLYLERQKRHRGVAVTSWFFDLFFRAIFGRGEDAAANVAWAIAQLAWRLSFGAIIALIDFAIRLPYRFKQYDLYADFEPGSVHNNDDAAVAAASGDVSFNGIYDSVILSSTNEQERRDMRGRSSFFSSLLLWCLIMCGATLSTLFTIAVYCSVPCGCAFGLAYLSRRQRAARRAAMNDPNGDNYAQRLHAD